jgi:uncharacterized protein with NRDE domain
VCLLVFAWRSHPAYPLVLAGNRDEFHDRPAAPADWWEDAPDVVAGRDLRAGGTWLGANRRGRFAVVTNYREPMEEGRGPRSRGELVADFLAGDTPPGDYAGEVGARGHAYGGFNLLVGDTGTLAYVSNRGRGPEILPPGIYGLSNHLLDTPWPKLERARARFAETLGDDAEPGAVMQILADRTPAPDEALPRTGIGLEWERLLSPAFISSPLYGTRCTTVLRLSAAGAADLSERRFDAEGRTTGESRFEFRI